MSTYNNTFEREEVTDLTDFETLKGFEDYKINIKKGIVINDKRWILARKPVRSGYHITQLPGNGTQAVHRLVWKQKYGEIPKDRHVDHIDDNPGNNTITNLQLLTTAENIKKAYAKKSLKGIRMKSIPIIARNYETKVESTFQSISKASAALNIESARISAILRGKGRTVKGGNDVRYEFSLQDPIAPILAPIETPSPPEPTRVFSSEEPAAIPVLERVSQKNPALVAEKGLKQRSVVDWMIGVVY